MAGQHRNSTALPKLAKLVGDPEPDDIFGAWPRAAYIAMDSAFVDALSRAIRRGRENAGAVSATVKLKP